MFGVILFIILMIAVFGKLIGLCIKAAWGITRICFRLIFLPIVLIMMAALGFVWIAIPVLFVIGIIALCS